MRYVLISDIHSNSMILDKVLKELEKEDFDEFIFLGDYITDGQASKEVLNKIKSLGGHTIRGNRENYILNFDEKKRGFVNYDTIADTYDSLSSDDIDYIKSLKEYEILDLNGVKTLLIHGEATNYAKSMEEFYDKMIEAFDFDLCLYGHTHRFDDTTYRGRRFINPGSLSQASDTPSFKYALLEIGEGITLEKRELPVEDHFKELVEYYKNTEYYKRHLIWSTLFLLLTRDAKDYPCRFIDYFEAQEKDFDVTNRELFNAFYTKCFEEFMREVTPL